MDLPLIDETDIQIIIHRNVHFGGNFAVMIQYYEEDGVGVNDEFDLDRIIMLNQVEKSLGEDLANKVLPTQYFEDIEKAKEIYVKLRDVYDNKDAGEITLLISDLILTEEIDPLDEINALVAKKELAVGALLQLVDSTVFYDSLSPGYGRAPIFAARALAKIGNARAIPHLYLALGQESFDAEEAIISALRSFGNEAKTFLLKRVQEKPYSVDNERAAAALAAFLPDEEVEQVALKLLHENDFHKHETFGSYLACLLAETKSQACIAGLEELSTKKNLPHDVQAECLHLVKSWKLK